MNKMTPTNSNQVNLGLYNTPASLSQYIIHNLFRILRPIRRKFNLTINEIIILNSIVLYTKFESTSFSQSSILRYIGYFNSNKIIYYLGSLKQKGYIEVYDIIKCKERLRINEKGLNVISYIEESYQMSLIKFIEENSIEV